MGSVRTVAVRVTAEVQDLSAKMRKAGNDVKSFATTSDAAIQKNRAAWSGLSSQVGLLGAGLLAASALAVKGFADFDKSMSKVKATGADAAANLDALRDAAVQAGADTMYSAADAADAITDLAKAGVSAKDILGGGLTGALALAASGEMEVKDAAEVTATALAQFNLDGTQASHVADLLASSAGKAMGEVSDFGYALRQGGLVASQVGLSIEETTAALAAFAQQGLIGSDAGTSLKTMLQRLTPTSAKADAQFEKLGISAYDATGEFVGLADFAGQLQTKMSDLSPEARNAAMNIMFGADAVRGANVLYSEGADGIQEWINQVDDAGFASRQAAALTDNLAGDIERLGGSIETVFIQSGSGANDVLRQWAQNADAAVDAFGKLPAPILNAGALLTGAGGLGLLGAAGIMKLVGAISDAKASFEALRISAGTAKAAIGGVGAALAIGTLALSAWVEQQARANQLAKDFAATLVVIDGKASTTAATMEDFNDALINTTLSAPFGLFGDTVIDIMDRFGISVEDAQGYLLGEAEAVERVKGAIADYGNTAKGATDQLAGLYSGQLLKFLDEQAAGLSEAEKRAIQAANANEEVADSAGTYTDALAAATSQTDGATTALEDYADALFAAAEAELKLAGNEVGWHAALTDTRKAIKETGEARRLDNGYLDLNTKKGQANQKALLGLATSSLTYTKSLIEQGASEEKVQGVLAKSRTAFIKQATAAGMSKDAARALATELGLVPEKTKADLVTDLDRSGINEWKAFKPGDKYPKITPKLTQSTFAVTLKTAWRINGGPKFSTADGAIYALGGAGLLRSFADGGSFATAQPQIQANRGPRGIQWAETGAGPWEAFISGSPAKRQRSLDIWAQVGQRLGAFASGGFAMGGLSSLQVSAAPAMPATASTVQAAIPSAAEIAVAMANVLQSRGMSWLMVADRVSAITEADYGRA